MLLHSEHFKCCFLLHAKKKNQAILLRQATIRKPLPHQTEKDLLRQWTKTLPTLTMRFPVQVLLTAEFRCHRFWSNNRFLSKSQWKLILNFDETTACVNGTRMIQNISGGLIRNMTSEQLITHKLRGNVQASFDNGTASNWQLVRQRIISLNNEIYDVTIKGGTSVNSTSNVGIWGTNRLEVPSMLPFLQRSF